MGNGSVFRKLVCETANFLRQMGPVIAGIAAIVAPIWFLAEDTVNAWVELPERIARIEARVGDQDPFIEFQGSARMWPERVNPGTVVKVIYTLRRNRDCNTVVERRFQLVDGAGVNPLLTSRGSAAATLLTLGFEVSVEEFSIPENIQPGLYAYRPVLYCPDEVPVSPPTVFFEVR